MAGRVQEWQASVWMISPLVRMQIKVAIDSGLGGNRSCTSIIYIFLHLMGGVRRSASLGAGEHHSALTVDGNEVCIVS